MQLFQLCCVGCSFVFSLRTIRNEEIPRYMKGFYWYSVVTFLLVVIFFRSLLANGDYIKLSLSVNKLSFLFHFVFLGIFIYKVLNSLKAKKAFLKLFVVFFIVISVVTIITIPTTNSFWINSFTNFFLVILSLFYYYDLFESKPVKNLFYEPSFFVVSGLFLSLTITVPVSVIRNFMSLELNLNANLIMAAIGSFAYGVMHLFFVKAYICSVNRKGIL